MSARGGGRGGALAAAITFKTDKDKKSVAAYIAGHAALRAAQRVNWMKMDPEMEICKLQQQLKELGDDADLKTTEEYDCILQRFLQLEHQCKEKVQTEMNKAAKEANKTEGFTCAICFAKQPLSTLRLLVPCGHGFCVTCTSKLESDITRARSAQEQDIPGCFNCRGQVTSVLRAYL